MDAKETVKYLYENGHIMGREHYKIICDELKPITEHPDVQRLIGQVVELQAENERLEVENAKLKNLLRRGIDILESWKALKGQTNDR